MFIVFLKLVMTLARTMDFVTGATSYVSIPLLDVTNLNIDSLAHEKHFTVRHHRFADT